jgi:gamma-glutamylcyclotransferase (GGCT)/AIG2-like uncharacterized protein YtfP
MRLFAYGTLMRCAILADVVGRVLEGKPAVLEGYKRMRVKHELYPVLVAGAASDAVAGLLYEGLESTDWLKLDRFEGEEYQRITVLVDNSEAEVYLLAEGYEHIVSDEEWVLESFDRDEEARFRASYRGW